MKRVLITGANSYIGTSFENYMKEHHPNEFEIDTLDMKDPHWIDYDFSGYDSVFHVAGIAHQKETKENEHLYYKVNRDLAMEVAKKTKISRVKQFVFMSSMSVYGLDSSDELINENTATYPKTYYGKSKLEAENVIAELRNDNFKVALVRPPMVYGDNCPGNMTRLLNAVRKYRVFPTIKNERSSITVENLCEDIYLIINSNKEGIFLPQNSNYMCTYEIIKESMKKENIKVIYLSIFNPIIKILIGKLLVVTKAFGDLKYEVDEK